MTNGSAMGLSPDENRRLGAVLSENAQIFFKTICRVV
jgi:hypothetical protein